MTIHADCPSCGTQVRIPSRWFHCSACGAELGLALKVVRPAQQVKANRLAKDHRKSSN
jgi:hypothetical protein